MFSDSFIHRFELKIIKSSKNECWNWSAYKDKEGYGQIKLNGKKVWAHRISYELYNGPIKNGLIICHKCDNPSCVNPSHLYAGTNKDNTRDMILRGRKGKTYSHLTIDDVKAIRLKYKTNNYSYNELAKEYNISSKNIGSIIKINTWKNL